MMTREQQIIYAAGLFDGEGCCGVYADERKHCIVRFQLAMCSPMGPQLFAELFGGHVKLGTHVRRAKRTTGEEYLPVYSYVITSDRAAAALRELLPWLRDKRAQAELCIEARMIQRNRRRGVGAGYSHQELVRLTAIRNEVRALKRGA